MGAYQQMGHNSSNLLFQDELADYEGAILSPVNEDEAAVRELLERARSERPKMRMIFDPQLYVPTSNRGQLRSWKHFPDDVESADLASEAWWTNTNKELSTVVKGLGVDAACSPVVVPRVYSDTYYARCVSVGDELGSRLPKTEVLQTVLVDLDNLTADGRPDTIASIISASELRRVFLVVCASIEPRREIADVDGLKGVMRLIKLLEEGGQSVLVGFCSSEVLLWKAAGASSCATGKFFNLRRFTPSRFEEPGGGGGQLPYWFEEGLFAYLRQPDVLRVERAIGFSDATQRNPFTETILQKIRAGEPWVAEGWRQFMWWFADFEARADRALARESLRTAERNWRELEDRDVLMEEARNDGGWIRPWRRAVAEFDEAPPERDG